IRKLSCTYIATSDEVQAMKACKSFIHPFDYIFMDVNMLLMDGFAATCEIRTHECDHRYPPSQIVAHTGLRSATSPQTAFACEVDLFLTTKPVPTKSLKDILKRHQGVIKANKQLERKPAKEQSPSA
ncbi:hypothetical protein K432DRAFT_302547, partial [Lepidopterella palustris CBS 459.81]